MTPYCLSQLKICQETVGEAKVWEKKREERTTWTKINNVPNNQNKFARFKVGNSLYLDNWATQFTTWRYPEYTDRTNLKKFVPQISSSRYQIWDFPAPACKLQGGQNLLTIFIFVVYFLFRVVVVTFQQCPTETTFSTKCLVYRRRFANHTELSWLLPKRYAVAYELDIHSGHVIQGYIQYRNILRVLLGTLRHCSASCIIVESRTDDFCALSRKIVSYLLNRVRVATTYWLCFPINVKCEIQE